MLYCLIHSVKEVDLAPHLSRTNFLVDLSRDGSLHGLTEHFTCHDSLSKTILPCALDGGRRLGQQRKCWMDNIKEWTSLPRPELLTRTFCRKDWKRISAESSLLCPQRPSQSRDWTELNWVSCSTGVFMTPHTWLWPSSCLPVFMSVKFIGFVYTFVCSVAGEHGRVPSRRQDGGSLGNTGPQTATLQLPYLRCAYAPSAQVQCLTTICVLCFSPTSLCWPALLFSVKASCNGRPSEVVILSVCMGVCVCVYLCMLVCMCKNHVSLKCYRSVSLTVNVAHC